MFHKKSLHPWQYFYVILFMTIVSIFETQIPFLRRELVGTPYLLVTTVTAIYGDYLAGALAIVVGSLAVGFVSAMSLHLHVDDITKIFEILIAGIIIYVLAWRSRDLAVSNLSLSESADHMELAVKKLKNEARINKKDLDRVGRLNSELRGLVDNIMEDQKLWASNVERDVKRIDSSREIS